MFCFTNVMCKTSRSGVSGISQQSCCSSPHRIALFLDLPGCTVFTELHGCYGQPYSNVSYLRTGEEYNSAATAAAVGVVNDAAATPKFADVSNSVASLLLLMPLLPLLATVSAVAAAPAAPCCSQLLLLLPLLLLLLLLLPLPLLRHLLYLSTQLQNAAHKTGPCSSLK